MAGVPNYANTPNNGGAVVVSVGDTSRTAPVSAVTVLTAGSNGSRIERLSMTAVGSTVASVLRLFMYDGSSYHLYYEVPVPSYTASAGAAAWNVTLEAVDTPNIFPVTLKNGWSLRATVNDTQIAQELSINSIALAQTTASATYLNLNGALVTAAGAAGAIVVAAVGSANVPMTLTTTPYVLPSAAQITLSAVSTAAVSITLLGRDLSGALLTETLTGPGAGATVYSSNVYKVLYAVIPNAGTTNAMSVSYSAVALMSLSLPTKIMLSSGANLSGSSFTLVGTGLNGVLQTETIGTGPSIGQVQSVNLYNTITSIKTGAAVSSNVLVGNPPVIGGISLAPIAGDF